MFAIFVRYSRGSHRISNEVCQNVSVLSALLLTSWPEMSILSNCFFSFSIFKMYVYTLLMWNFGFENRVRWPTQQPPLKTFLFEWKWILIGLWGFINWFWLNNFAPKLRYGVQNRLRSLLEHAIRFPKIKTKLQSGSKGKQYERSMLHTRLNQNSNRVHMNICIHSYKLYFVPSTMYFLFFPQKDDTIGGVGDTLSINIFNLCCMQQVSIWLLAECIYVICRLRVGPYSEKLWPRSWKFF